MARRTPMVAEPDHRYLRRRANRRVRKQRLTRNAFRFMLKATSYALIGGVVLYVAFHAVDRFLRSDEFSLDRVAFRGVERASTEALRSRLATFEGRNLLYLSLTDVENTLLREPWVERVSVKRMLPRGVRVTVVEREPVAWARIAGTVHVVDGRGFALGPAERAGGADLPVLTGVDAPTREETIERLRRGARLVERLRHVAPGFLRRVSEVDLARADRVEVRTVAGGAPLWLDPERIERNVDAWMELDAEIARRVGRARYVDLRWKDRIAVMPNHTKHNDRQREGT